jgi:hypothetical protein
VQLEFKVGHDTEVPATPAHAPEQVYMVSSASCEHTPIGGDDVNREQVVDSQTMFAHKPTESATEGEAGKPGTSDGSSCSYQPKLLCLADEFA